MDLCSRNHEEVCYEDRTCPACAVIEAMNNAIADLENEIEILKSEVKAWEESV
jgi:hypothetical protein